MIVSDILKEAGFTAALIVDDAFDEIPTATDLALDAEAWSIFIDDIGGDIDHVVTAYPQYHDQDANELRGSDQFVAAMYGLKGTIRPELWNTLFETYERNRGSDRALLDTLRERLIAAGLDVKTAGRKLPDGVGDCRIIFADLFLGAAQQDLDVERSIQWIRRLVDERPSAPPAVVLMSRSPSLQDRKERFRDNAKMIGALFRVHRKQDLIEGSTLETILERLATHYADAVRVAAFLAAWESGVADATKEFMKVVRRLDLSDYTKIREVLLEAEGQPLGSYMLDVFDRVLQHEIEGHTPTIYAAQQLSQVDPSKYPTPYIAGSPDLQHLVAKSLWQHRERLKVTANTAGMPVSFGDVLVRKPKLDNAPAQSSPPDEPDALVVLTPACDLVRPGKQRALLVGGALNTLDHRGWSYKSSAGSTPIVELPQQPRMSIKWDLSDQRMLTREEITALLGEGGQYVLSVRLRESNALELQQLMLAAMGRVGLISKMPFTFPVEVRLLTPEIDGTTKPLELPATTRDGGVCITGRDSGGEDLTHLILTETSVDEILTAIAKLEGQQVHERARETLRRLQASASFRSQLRRGLLAPTATPKGSLKPLKVPAAVAEGEKARDEIVGLIVRNPGELPRLSANDLKNGALIIALTDLEPNPFVIGPAETPAEGVVEGADPVAMQ